MKYLSSAIGLLLIGILMPISNSVVAREISQPLINRTGSQVAVRFKSSAEGEYRIYSSQKVLCRYGKVNAGDNRIHMPKVSSNEELYVQVLLSGRNKATRENDFKIDSMPYFSPFEKLKTPGVIYQLPLRTYLAQGLGQQMTGKFRSLSTGVLKQIRAMGVDYLWLTGVLQHADPRTHDPDVIKGQAGSYYAISDNWDVSEDLGSLDEFDALVKRIHSVGLRVLMDFIPNHTARVHETDVECKHLLNFGRGDSTDKFFHPQNNYFYLSSQSGPFVPPYQMGWPGVDGVFDTDISVPGIQPEFPAKATGSDVVSSKPPLNAWFETAKLNYGYNFTTKKGDYSQIPKTWHIMVDIAKYWLARGVDGFRVDFAHSVPLEFWHWFAQNVKSYQPNTYLVAEAYEQDEGMKVPGFSYERLYQAGFDTVYNSQLYWKMRNQAIHPGSMYEANYSASPAARPFFKQHGLFMTNYVENHDELRVAHEKFSPSLKQQGDRMRNGWAHFTYAALLPANILIHGGQEVGEDASVFGPFARENGRTSIFDYVYQSQTLKWLQGKLEQGGQKLRTAYTEVLRFKHNSPFSIRHSNSHPSFIDLLPVNAWKEQNKWIGSYLRFDDKSAFLVVSNLDPVHSHPATVHFTNKSGEDPLGALRAMRIQNNINEKYIFVEVLSRRGWIPTDPNLSGTGVPGVLLYRNGGVPSGFHIGEMPPRTTYVFKLVPFGEFGRGRPQRR